MDALGLCAGEGWLIEQPWPRKSPATLPDLKNKFSDKNIRAFNTFGP